jgi:hypothetical protein
MYRRLKVKIKENIIRTNCVTAFGRSKYDRSSTVQELRKGIWVFENGGGAGIFCKIKPTSSLFSFELTKI